MKINAFEIDGKEICVVDDFFSSEADRDRLYLALATLNYRIDGRNFNDVQNRPRLRLTATVDNNFANEINLFAPERQAILHQQIPPETYQLYESYCNLGLVSDYQEPHVDNYAKGACKTLIIYANRHWQDNWGGETYFYSDDAKEIMYVSKNTPGRAIIFDSSIPHMGCVQNMISNQYRFTIAAKFINREAKPTKNTDYL